MKTVLTIATVCGMAFLASADTFEQAQIATGMELRQSVQELSDLRSKIAEERIPMAKDLDEVQALVISKRSERNNMRGLADTSGSSLISLQDQVSSLKDNVNYMTNLLGDYVIRYETLTGLSERAAITAKTKAASEAKENDNLNAGKRLEVQLAVIDSAINRLNNVIGGYSFNGEAILSTGGQEVKGKYLLIGPASFFSPDDIAVPAGITTENPGSLKPIVNTLKDPKASPAIRTLVDTGSNVASYGPQQALMVESQDQSLIDEWITGGMVMPFILGLAFLAFIVAVIKWFSLAGVKSARQKDLDAILELLAQGNVQAASDYASKLGGPVGEMLTVAVENAGEDREVIEEVLYEKIISTQPKLERMLPFIAVVAATAPLLGLLGTVTGMIKTFKLITIVGTGDARSLSSGISEALITTKWGLISAIPALIVHAMLSRKARGVIGSMEQTAVGFINGVVEIRETNTQSA